MLIVVVTGLGHHFQAVSAQTEMLTADPLTMPGRGSQSNRAMSKEETKREIKLWLLALALAVVLTWYVINPAPGPIRLHKRDDNTPDADRSEAQAQITGTSLRFGTKSAIHPMAALFSAVADDDLPDWPEYIELD